MYQERILICVPAPIRGVGLGVQFDNWGSQQIETVITVQSAMESVIRHTPALLVRDADWPNTEENFTFLQLLRRNSKSIPVIFISQHHEQSLAWQEQLQRLGPYRWLSKPCHTEDLWQEVVSLLPNINNSAQQG